MLSLGFIVRNPNEKTDITNGFISKCKCGSGEWEKKNAMLQLQGTIFLEIFREPHWIERLHKSNGANGVFYLFHGNERDEKQKIEWLMPALIKAAVN